MAPLKSNLTLTTGAVAEPMTLAEAKTQLRVENTDSDTEITTLIIVVRKHVERVTNLSLIDTVWAERFDFFPPFFEFLRAPISAIGSVTYLDEDGVSQTLAASKYVLDGTSKPSRLVEADGEVWPTTQHMVNAVTVNYTAGFGATSASVDEDIIHALKLLLTHYYENRSATWVEKSGMTMPLGVASLLAPHKVSRGA